MAKRYVYAYSAVCPACGEARTISNKKLVGARCAKCNREKHGYWNNRQLYICYQNMMARCGHFNYRIKIAKHYADRGIFVCDEWRLDRTKFYSWAMANGFAAGLTLDRINNDGPYSPANCRWVSQTENNKNRRPINYIRKLTAEQVATIRARRATGEKIKSIATDFPVTYATVKDILRGKIWKVAPDGNT